MFCFYSLCPVSAADSVELLIEFYMDGPAWLTLLSWINRFSDTHTLSQIDRPEWGREGNLPHTASEPHFTYLRQCASPEGFRTSPNQSSWKDLSFRIVNFHTIKYNLTNKQIGSFHFPPPEIARAYTVWGGRAGAVPPPRPVAPPLEEPELSHFSNLKLIEY